MARSPCRWLGGLLLAVTFGAAGCGSGTGDSEGCGPITREAIDPAYLVHVVADDPNVEYSSDPPTSGPHQPAPPVAGVTDDPISRPVQVGILERGDVLLQYDPGLDRGSVATLHALAGDAVVVAPNPDLPAPVVATAWLFKRTCRTVDPDDLQTFVDERRGRGPEG
jgi:hypothetical protein